VSCNCGSSSGHDRYPWAKSGELGYPGSHCCTCKSAHDDRQHAEPELQIMQPFGSFRIFKSLWTVESVDLTIDSQSHVFIDGKIGHGEGERAFLLRNLDRGGMYA